MRRRRIVSLVVLVLASSGLALVIARLPGGLRLEWRNGMPALIMTDSVANADSIRAARAHVLERIVDSDTYLPHVLTLQDSTLWRWPDRTTDPINVFVFKDAGPDRERAVRRAFTRWQDARIPVRFQFLARPAGADVFVRWSDTIIHPLGHTDVGGYVDPEWEQEWYTGGTVWIGLRHPQSPRPWSGQQIYQTALHEIGHLLGLHHSPHPNDIMWHESSAPDLSARDMRTIRLLYALPPGPVDSDLLRE